jgi:hypothetical protein
MITPKAGAACRESTTRNGRRTRKGGAPPFKMTAEENGQTFTEHLTFSESEMVT